MSSKKIKPITTMCVCKVSRVSEPRLVVVMTWKEALVMFDNIFEHWACMFEEKWSSPLKCEGEKYWVTPSIIDISVYNSLGEFKGW